MLFTVDGKRIDHVAREAEFESATRCLGAERADAVRQDLGRIIDSLPPDGKTGKRTFNSSHLGSELTPWKGPLRHLNDAASQMEGPNASEDATHTRAGMLFGLFIWEHIMGRDEEWRFYDPSLPRDANREFSGKVYFEQ